jgi:FkbM family methyltransferase
MIPPFNFSLYEFCVRYVDRFNGDNNSNSEENGEYFFLRNELSKLGDGVVFDVGANVGKWASAVLNINPKVNLHCFEPCKTTYANLVLKNFPSNVQLNNFGLSDFEGELVLNVYDQASGLNSIYLRKGVETAMPVKTEQISVSTIDLYCEKNRIQKIDLIKVDVEGHELAVFQGMKQMLDDRRINVIQFEYGGCNLDAKIYLEDIWNFIEPYGFYFFKLFPAGPRHIKRYQQSLETFKYSNWVAIHVSHNSI